MSCDVLNVGPAELVVTFGRTRVKMVSGASTANAALAPWSWKPCSWWRTPPERRHKPTMPLHTIITTANTVSRTRPALSAATPNMMETISATSMTVGEDKGAKRLPDAMRNDLGVVDGRKHGGDQNRSP